MADRSQKFLRDVRKCPGNDRCADCNRQDPEWAVWNLGIFVCESCCNIHRSLGTHISQVKSISFDKWDEDQLRIMEAQGNVKSKRYYEQQVPACYKLPTPKDPAVLREQWIRAKYQRLEFVEVDKQTYLQGHKEGYLWKRGKEDKKFLQRKFILDEKSNTLKYYNKEDAKDPKAVMRIDELNVTIVPEKVGNPNAMQITFEQDGHTRNLFVHGDDGQEIVSWFNAIRSTKLNRLRIAFPGAKDGELRAHLTRDFTKEGWLSKTGPRAGDAFRRRWVSLDKRKLMYYEDPLDAFPKGEIFLGTKDKGYGVREGLTPGVKDPGYTFTLKTPDRDYHFCAEADEDVHDWMLVIKGVIGKPLSPQDSSNWAQSRTRKRTSSLLKALVK